MSQNDFVINNDTANAVRLDLQSAFQALATNNSGNSAPSTPYANQWWYETDTNLLKIRNEANTGWINVAYVNQSTSKFEILDDTKVVNTSGTQVGVLGDQATSTWQAGTGTTETLVSPAKIKASIISNAVSVGVGQTWQTVSRAPNTSYRNTTGMPIMVNFQVYNIVDWQAQVSTNGSSWVTVADGDNSAAAQTNSSFIVPDDHYYRLYSSQASPSFTFWSELR